MNPQTDELSTLQAQLAEKTDLVAALTAQLEKTVAQLDRLRRSGADRIGSISSSPGSGLHSELAEKLTSAINDWQDFQPAERITRIEEGVERILQILESPDSARTQHAGKAESSTQDQMAAFWEAEKARLLAESPASNGPPAEDNSKSADEAPTASAAEESQTTQRSDRESSDQESEEAPFAEIGNAPPAPTPVTESSDHDELMAGIKSRDTYILYLTSRLRTAESKKYIPVRWELLDSAPDQFRSRLESLETLLQDHLRQAEIAHSLERALLARERAKLAQVKQNLEMQIRKMILPQANNSVAAEQPPPSDSGKDLESRWKKIFSR